MGLYCRSPETEDLTMNLTKQQRKAIADMMYRSQGYQEAQAIRAKAQRRARVKRAVLAILIYCAGFGVVAYLVRHFETQLQVIEGS